MQKGGYSAPPGAEPVGVYSKEILRSHASEESAPSGVSPSRTGDDRPGNRLSLVFVGELMDLTFEQVSHLKMAPFFPSFGRLTLTPIPSSLASASEFARSSCASLPRMSPDFDEDKESVAKDARVDAAV